MEVEFQPVYSGGIRSEGYLSELLMPNGYVQIGQPDTGNFDAVCFDLNRKSQNMEYRIVQVDHEEILCKWKVRISGELLPSFVKLMESTIKLPSRSVCCDEPSPQRYAS